MHRRSLPRWTSLASKTHHGSGSLRAGTSAYSTSALNPKSESEPKFLLEALSKIADADSDRKGKGSIGLDEARKEVGEGIPVTLDQVWPVKKSSRRPFQPMDGGSMKPVSEGSKRDPSSSGGVVVQAGICFDNRFRPLKDVNKWQRIRVPRLAHGLREVLSRPGVHPLRDPKSKEFNFTGYLENIPKVSDFAFDKLPGFVPSSQDKALIACARKAKCKYVGSTSSLTGILTQIYLLLSEEKLVDISKLSNGFADAPRFFTPGQRIPVSVILRYQNGVYTTDYDDSRDESNEDIILLPLGTLLEKFLTLPKKIFSRFLKSHTADNYPTLKDVHRYAKHGNFLMRSQLDCVDDSLPGTGVFDLKTRAITSIRHDVRNYLNYTGVSLENLTGRRDSFEEEYYDMIRAAFLEYSFQARIGNMDGVLVAYHNTARLFGFQYVSLNEMDRCLFGREGAGMRVFERCVWFMEMLYKHITECFPNESVQCTFEKRGKLLRVWVEPLENPNPGSEPPVVELNLSLTNIMQGKPVKGPYAVYTTDKPWSVQYTLERIDTPQASVIARRRKAYKRQECIANTLPDADPAVQAEAEEALIEEAENDIEEAEQTQPPS